MLTGIGEELENTKTQLENAHAEMETPFSKESELTQKTARLKDLNMGEKDSAILDFSPDEGDMEPTLKVAGLER